MQLGRRTKFGRCVLAWHCRFKGLVIGKYAWSPTQTGCVGGARRDEGGIAEAYEDQKEVIGGR